LPLDRSRYQMEESMNDAASSPLSRAIGTLLHEALEGADPKIAWILNPSDPGLLASLDRLSAEQASARSQQGSAPIAAHAAHLLYGLQLLNRASSGENPYAGADWSRAWRTEHVTRDEWERLRGELRKEASRWQEHFATLLDAGELELTGVLASVAHIAYHMGAIRQIDRSARGPSASG
jgi:hypothetical protein